MAQTQRTIEAVYNTSLDDNTVGETRNEDIRDAVETLRSRVGELYLDTPAPTGIGIVGIPVKLLGTTLLSTDPAAYEISMPADNQLQYDGTAKAIAAVRGLVSLQLVSGVNQNISVYIAKNGTVVSRSEAPRLHTGTSDVSRMTLEILTEVVNGDFLELWVANNTSTANVTAQKLQLIIETKAIQS